MPMHDWTLVPAGIYHAFQIGWISAIADRLNADLLSNDLYAIVERAAPEFDADDTTRFVSEAEVYVRKKNVLAIRHTSGDGIVAVIEIVSPGNKSSEYPLEKFVQKACDFVEHGVHLLILDPFPPGPRDPDGVHALIWRQFHPEPFRLPVDKPLTLVAYESETPTRAYVEPVAVGDRLPDMPLFVVQNGCVMIPLEETYRTAFDVQPRRWRRVLDPAA